MHSTFLPFTIDFDYIMAKSSLFHSVLRLPMATLLLSLPQIASAQQACQISQPLTYSVIHQQPVSINTDVLYNTTFYPYPGISVAVDNAPTSLDGVTTFSWTETKTHSEYSRRTRTLTATQATTTADDSTFVMLVLGAMKHNRKRLSGSYWVEGGHTLLKICADS